MKLRGTFGGIVVVMMLVACGGKSAGEFCEVMCSKEAQVCGEEDKATCLANCNADPTASQVAACDYCFEGMECVDFSQATCVQGPDGENDIDGAITDNDCMLVGAKCQVCAAGGNAEDPFLETCFDSCVAQKASAEASGSCDEYGGVANVQDCELGCLGTLILMEGACIDAADSCFSCLGGVEFECVSDTKTMQVDTATCQTECADYVVCANEATSGQ